VHLGQNFPEDALEEYDSPETVTAIASALESQGHSVVKLGGGRVFLANVLREEVNLVFNIAEGLGSYRSREAQVPGVLEMLGIPYTGSDPQCLAICLDKPLTKKLVAGAGVRTPKWEVIASHQQLREVEWGGLTFPVFLKPTFEGSSKGIRSGSMFDNPGQAARAVEDLLVNYQQPVMVEEFIDGDEVTVGLLGNSPPRVVGIMRILPKKSEGPFIYSLEVKRDYERLVDYECPARLDENVIRGISDASLKAFAVLGCRDFARLDFRISRDGKPYFIEVNPLPGLNPKTADLMILAGKMGWSYQALISGILNAALERYPNAPENSHRL